MNEYTEWHLTPRGWERGSSQTRFGGIRHVDSPPDRVLTYRHTLAGESSADSVEEQWRSAEAEAIEGLLARFGGFAG